MNESLKAITLERRDDGIAIVWIDVPGEKQNTLKAEFNEQFNEVLRELESGAGARAVVIASAKNGSFMAGADIGMLETVTTAAEAEELSRAGQDGFARLEASSVPFVAAIDGPCLGGGMELALACHARICTDAGHTVLGLPEVKLGLLPGAGGTQRMPRLVGIANALDLMLTGKNVRPKKARKMGLVDEVVPAPILLQAAIALATKLADGKPARKDKGFDAQRLALEDNPLGRNVLFSQARKKTLGQTKGNYPAAERIIDAVEVGYRDGIKAGYAAEARFFGDLVVSPEAEQLMNIFRGMNALKRDTGVDDASIEPRTITKLGMLGAGLMGSGIAYVTVEKADVDVRLKDRDDEGLARGLKSIRKNYDKAVKRKWMLKTEADRQMSRVTTTTNYAGFAGCEIVVEAVFESLDLKHQMVRDVEQVGAEDVIFASNTSSIPISRIAEASTHPETVIGMHYFSPVEKMPLLEIVVTDKTASWVTATCVELGKKQGKTVIVVKDGPGFYTTRILAPYLNEAAYLIASGVPIEKIDQALEAYGYPVGPITLLDEVGIDVGAKVGPVLLEAFGERMKAPGTTDALINDGRLGRKAKKGFYRYDGKKKKGKKQVDEAVYDVLGIRPTNDLDPKEIAERCLLMMVNEAVMCLEEGILRSPRDGDIGAIFGLGFPPFRGGPFRYVDHVGAHRVVEKLEHYRSRYGMRFTPAESLVEMAKSGARFHE